MLNRIEIYFILYLGLLMAFFGIDSEVADYMEKQKRILEQVARYKLKDIIKVSDQQIRNSGDKILMDFILAGNYDSEYFEGDLLFVNQSKIVTAKSSLKKDEDSPNSYSSMVKIDEFGKHTSEQYDLKLSYETKPYFSASTKLALEKSYGSIEIATKIIENIEKEGTIKDTIDIAHKIIPDEKDAVDPFILRSTSNPFTGLENLPGEITLFVAGTNDESDYRLTIDQSLRSRYRINVIKKKSKVTIKLGRLQNGTIHITGERFRDGLESTVNQVVVVRSPEWQYTNETEIYTGDPYKFNGALREFGSNNERRYTLVVTGTSFPSAHREKNSSSLYFDRNQFSSPGRFSIQLYIDDNIIDNMRHEVTVSTPPPPDWIVEENGRTPKFIVTAYGYGHKITDVRFLGGVEDASPEFIEVSDEHGQIRTYPTVRVIQNVPRVELRFRIESNYSDDVIDSKKLLIQ